MSMKKQIIIFSLFFILSLSFVLADCVVPTDGMRITTSTVLCPDTYNLPNGIELFGDYIVLDCNNSILNGTRNINSYGVLLNQSSEVQDIYGQQVINCNIKNYDYSIYVRPTGGGTNFHDMNISNNNFSDGRRSHIYFAVSQEKMYGVTEISNNYFGDLLINHDYMIRFEWLYDTFIFNGNHQTNNSGTIYLSSGQNPSMEITGNIFENRLLLVKFDEAVFRDNLFNWTTTQSYYNTLVLNNPSGHYLLNNTFYAGNIYENGINYWCVNGSRNYFYGTLGDGDSCPTPNATRRFEFEETTGTEMTDTGTVGENGVYSLGFNLSQEGVSGNSVQFTLPPLYEGISFNATGLNISTDSDFSLSFWMYYPSGGSGLEVLGFAPYPYTLSGTDLQIGGQILGSVNSGFNFGMRDQNTNEQMTVNDGYFTRNRWVLTTISYNGKGDKKLRIFANGILKGEAQEDAGWSVGNSVSPTDTIGFSRYSGFWDVPFSMDDLRIYSEYSMDGRDALALFNSYPPIINSVTNTTTTTSINLTFNSTNFTYVEWYKDGVLNANNSVLSRLYSGLTINQTYNVSFILHNTYGQDYWEGLITTNSTISCVNPTSNTLYTGEVHFCSGEYTAKNVRIGSNARVYFDPAGTVISGYGVVSDEEGVIKFEGDNALLDCNGGNITGATENDGSGFGDGQGSRGLTYNAGSDNNTVQNCNIFHNKFAIFTWIDVSYNNFINISLDDAMYSGFHGGGDYAYLYNVRAYNEDLFMLGLHQRIDNVYVEQSLGLGHPDPCCTTAKWSGQVINSESNGLNLYNFPSADSYNISTNHFTNWVNFNDGGGNNGQQFFYNNVVDGGGVNDNTDYDGGSFITFCIGGIGGLGNTYEQGYNGGDPDSGTCPAQYCHIDFITGCRVTEDTTLPFNDYNVTDIWTQTGDNTTTLDCQGSTIYGDFTDDNAPQSNFIRINNVDLTVKNCNFRDFYTIAQSNSPNTLFDNVSWIEYKAPNIEDCEGCGFYYHFPQFYQWGNVQDYQTIQNSYFEGEVGLVMSRDFWTGYGDFCPDGDGNYITNSPNCNEWNYDNSPTEEDCAEGMWNADLSRCEDSRTTWWGGNCNGCDVNFEWFNGYWYACNLDNINKQTGHYIINNVINKTNSVLNGDNLGDNRFPTAYAVTDLQIINNTYIGSEDIATQDDYFMRLSGNRQTVVEGNRFLMEKFNRGLNINSHNWEEPMCPNVDLAITNNYFSAERTNADGGIFWHTVFSGVNNGIIQGNTYNYSGDRAMNMIQFDAQEIDLLNITITQNNFLPYPVGYDLYFTYWAENDMQNIDIYDNTFNELIVGDRQKGWDIKVYDNIFNGNLILDDSYSPYTSSQVDICNGGIGNTYNRQILFEYEQDYGYLSGDAWLDPDCNPLNVPEGIRVITYATDTNMPVNVYGNGITLNGLGAVGLFIDGTSPIFLENSILGDLNIEGYDTSVILGNFTQNNTLQNVNADACVVDDGTGNILLNVTQYCVCTENWTPINTPCMNTRQKILIYQDTNNCGTYTNLPANNGTMTTCIPPYNATHLSSDIAGVTIDTIVETGIELIKYSPLIALSGLAGYLLFLI